MKLVNTQRTSHKMKKMNQTSSKLMEVAAEEINESTKLGAARLLEKLGGAKSFP